MFQAERDYNGKLNFTISTDPFTICGKTIDEYAQDLAKLNSIYTYGIWSKLDDKPNNLKDLKRYIINENATILFWKDGTKTVVKRNPADAYDKRIGFLIAYFQYTSGLSKNKANKYLDNLIEEDR